MSGLAWVRDDGGRRAAGYRGYADDCACRAIAIAGELSYQAVYAMLNAAARAIPEPRGRRPGSAREGVYRPQYEHVMAALGFAWTPTMRIGSGCTVHLRAGELPGGRLVVRVSHHLTAVIDGTIRDTHDPSRDGSRCVYGYWTRLEGAERRIVQETAIRLGDSGRQTRGDGSRV
jgi:hypothetical protein